MATLELALLGPPVVTRNGAPVRFATRTATAVLARLAAGAHELSRERLAGLLWPEVETDRARASLRRTLSAALAAAGDGLVVTRMAVALDPDRTRADVREFEALAATADPGALDRAARLYRDDFLRGGASTAGPSSRPAVPGRVPGRLRAARPPRARRRAGRHRRPAPAAAGHRAGAAGHGGRGRG